MPATDSGSVFAASNQSEIYYLAINNDRYFTFKAEEMFFPPEAQGSTTMFPSCRVVPRSALRGHCAVSVAKPVSVPPQFNARL